MEESRKGAASIANTKNMSSSHDEDFGKDFLSSWKLPKPGNDTIEFDIDSVPKSNKFSFDKLDDFELEGTFDKLPSFKMDMPDLDFNTPLKKKVNNSSTNNEFSQEKKKGEQETFSFSFDFNELGKFNLDTKLGIEDKGTSKSTHKTDSSSLEGSKDPQRGPSGMGHDVLEANRHKEQPKPIHVTGQANVKSAGHPASIINSSHLSDKTHALTKITPTMMEQNKMGVEMRNQPEEHSDEVCPTKQNFKKSAQDFSHSSARGEDPTQATAVSEGCKETPSPEPLKVNLSKEKDKCGQSISSQSRCTSPVNSDIPRRLGQSDPHIDQNEVVEESASLKEGSQGSQSVKNISMKLLQKRLCGAKNTEEQTSSPNNHSSSVQREIRNAKPTSANERGSSSSILCILANMKTNRLPQLSSAPTCQLSVTNNVKIEKINTHFANLKREHKQVTAQAENTKISLSKSYYKPAPLGLRATFVNVKDDRSAKLSLELPPGKLPVLTPPSSTAHSTGHNVVSSHAFLESAKTSDTVQDPSSSDEKRTRISLLTGAKTAKVCSRSPNSYLLLDKESVEVRGSKGSPVIGASNTPNSFVEGKPTLLSPSLKRKMPEVSVPDQKTPNPLKRIMRSAMRKSPESAAELRIQTVLGNGTPKPRKDNVLSSTMPCEMGDISDLELPALVENDGNVEKAEACRMELEDICIVLRRKYTEAKELALRAFVNNNMMLMLNHPLFEEKICAVQKFANSLSSKKYLFEEIGTVDAGLDPYSILMHQHTCMAPKG